MNSSFQCSGCGVRNETTVDGNEMLYSYLNATIGSTFMARRAGT